MDTSEAPLGPSDLCVLETTLGPIEIGDTGVSLPLRLGRRRMIPASLLIGADCGAPDAELVRQSGHIRHATLRIAEAVPHGGLPKVHVRGMWSGHTGTKVQEGFRRVRMKMHSFHVLDCPGAPGSSCSSVVHACAVLRGLALGSAPEDTYTSQRQMGRRVLVLVNPHSGNRKALDIWHHHMAPWLEFSGLGYTLVTTDHAGHAIDVGREFDPDTHEGVCCISGDGMVQEFVSGMLSRQDWRTLVRRVPICSVACGTANALAVALRTAHPEYAALTLIKRHLRPLDAVLVSNGAGLRTVALCGIGWGIPADISVASEAHRWLGTARYAWLKARFGVSIMVGRTKHTARLEYSADVAMDDVALAAYFAKLQVPIPRATALTTPPPPAAPVPARAAHLHASTSVDRVAVLAVDTDALATYARGRDTQEAIATAAAMTSSRPAKRGVGRVLGRDSLDFRNSSVLGEAFPMNGGGQGKGGEGVSPSADERAGDSSLVTASATGRRASLDIPPSLPVIPRLPIGQEAGQDTSEVAASTRSRRTSDSSTASHHMHGLPSVLPRDLGALGVTNVTEPTIEVVRHMQEKEVEKYRMTGEGGGGAVAIARLQGYSMTTAPMVQSDGQVAGLGTAEAFSLPSSGVDRGRGRGMGMAGQQSDISMMSKGQGQGQEGTAQPASTLSPRTALAAGFGRLQKCAPGCTVCATQGHMRYLGHRRQSIVVRAPDQAKYVDPRSVLLSSVSTSTRRLGGRERASSVGLVGVRQKVPAPRPYRPRSVSAARAGNLRLQVPSPHMGMHTPSGLPPRAPEDTALLLDAPPGVQNAVWRAQQTKAITPLPVLPAGVHLRLPQFSVEADAGQQPADAQPLEAQRSTDDGVRTYDSLGAWATPLEAARAGFVGAGGGMGGGALQSPAITPHSDTRGRMTDHIAIQLSHSPMVSDDSNPMTIPARTPSHSLSPPLSSLHVSVPNMGFVHRARKTLSRALLAVGSREKGGSTVGSTSSPQPAPILTYPPGQDPGRHVWQHVRLHMSDEEASDGEKEEQEDVVEQLVRAVSHEAAGVPEPSGVVQPLKAPSTPAGVVQVSVSPRPTYRDASPPPPPPAPQTRMIQGAGTGGRVADGAPTIAAAPPGVAVQSGVSHIRGFPKYTESGTYVTIGCVNLGPDGPYTHPSDGYLDVIIARRGGVTATLGLLGRYVAGALLCGVTNETASPLYGYVKARSVTLTPAVDSAGGTGGAAPSGREGPGSRVCNVDGEVFPGPGPYRMHLMPSMLTAYGRL